MKKITTTLVLAFLTLCAHAQNSWQVIPQTANTDFCTICAVDHQSLLVATNTGDIYKTTNLGAEWYMVLDGNYSGANTPVYEYSIDMLNTQVGFAHIPGGLFKTTDGGNTWLPVNIPSVPAITKLQIEDENNFFFSENSQTFYKYSSGMVNLVFNVLDDWQVANASSKDIVKWAASGRYAYAYCHATVNGTHVYQLLSIDLTQAGTVSPAPVFTGLMYTECIFAFDNGNDLIIGSNNNSQPMIYTSQNGFQTHNSFFPSYTFAFGNSANLGLRNTRMTKLGNGDLLICGSSPMNITCIMSGTVLISHDQGLTWEPEQRTFPSYNGENTTEESLGEISNIYYQDITSYNNSIFLLSNMGILALTEEIVPQDTVVEDTTEVVSPVILGNIGTINGFFNIYEEGTYTYTIPAVENATGYLWTCSNPNWTLVSNNSTSVTLDFPMGTGIGILSVVAYNETDTTELSEISILAIVLHYSDIDNENNQNQADDQANETIQFAIENIANQKLKIYPNPVTNQLQIENYKIKEGEIVEIYDVFGHIVEIHNCASLPNSEPTIDISHLHAGIYFLKIKNNNHIIGNCKVVKQ
jgi:hypothetical protein